MGTGHERRCTKDNAEAAARDARAGHRGRASPGARGLRLRGGRRARSGRSEHPGRSARRGERLPPRRCVRPHDRGADRPHDSGREGRPAQPLPHGLRDHRPEPRQPRLPDDPARTALRGHPRGPGRGHLQRSRRGLHARGPDPRGGGEPVGYPAHLRRRRHPRLPHGVPRAARRGSQLQRGPRPGDRPHRRRGGDGGGHQLELRAHGGPGPRRAVGPHRGDGGGGRAPVLGPRGGAGARLPGRRPGRAGHAGRDPEALRRVRRRRGGASTTTPPTSPSAPCASGTCRPSRRRSTRARSP